MLLRLFFLTALLFINLFACKGGYTFCVAKIKDSNTIENTTLFIPIAKNQRLVYSSKKPDGKILKYDPFLSLYLLEKKSSFAYPFDFNMHLQLGTAIVTDKGSCEGEFLQKQIGLNQFARYSEKLAVPALITSSCCSLEGIVTKRGIIQKLYLKHFLRSKSSAYGDIGIRVQKRDGVVVICAVDPFSKKNPFKKGDKILQYDGKRITDASVLMQKVLFAPLSSYHTLKIQRAKRRFLVHVKTAKRYGGGFVSDTFLESRGLYFDSKLRLTKITGSFKNYGLVLGDRLIQVNGIKVKTQEELRNYIENFTDYSSLLFERNGFEFFVKIH